MRDIVAPESGRWRRFTEVFAEVVEPAGYQLVIPPIMEDLGVFTRIGDATDIVTKEMYDFEDKGGRRIALRPEGTASVVRAFVEHRPLVPWKAWYVTPAFRYEKPQKGRYRQHHQVGIEVLGVDDPDVRWRMVGDGPWFDNQLGTLRIDRRELDMRLERAVPVDEHSAGNSAQPGSSARPAYGASSASGAGYGASSSDSASSASYRAD